MGARRIGSVGPRTSFFHQVSVLVFNEFNVGLQGQA